LRSIPITAARQISKQYHYPEVVIFAYDPETGTQSVTTYGKSIAQCEDAARAGNYLKKALGWPNEMCHAKPKRLKKREEAIS
jgi:hypothetical protein